MVGHLARPSSRSLATGVLLRVFYAEKRSDAKPYYIPHGGQCYGYDLFLWRPHLAEIFRVFLPRRLEQSD